MSHGGIAVWTLLSLLAIDLAMILKGALLVRGGLWPKRQGDEPHCRSCGYLLIGIQSERCPECGTLLLPLNTVRGHRQRHVGQACIGVALLLIGLVILATPLVSEIGDIDWYHFKPTFLVMRDLRSSGLLANQALLELDRREKAGALSAKYERQIDEMALAQQATTASGQVAEGLIQFLEQQYLAGHLSDAQRTRFGQQSILLRLRVRPVVVSGDRVPWRIDESSRVCGPGLFVRVVDETRVEIDGKQLKNSGGGEGSMGGLGSGGSTSGSFECDEVGMHRLSVTDHVEVRQGNFGASTVLMQADRTLAADFEIVAKAPPATSISPATPNSALRSRRAFSPANSR